MDLRLCGIPMKSTSCLRASAIQVELSVCISGAHSYPYHYVSFTQTHTHDHPVVCTRTSTFSSISFLTLNTLTHTQINIEVFMCMLMYIIHCVNLPLSVASLIFFYYSTVLILHSYDLLFHFILSWKCKCTVFAAFFPICPLFMFGFLLALIFIILGMLLWFSSHHLCFFFLLLFFSHSLLLVYCFTGWNIPFAADAHNMPIKMDTMIFKCYK